MTAPSAVKPLERSQLQAIVEVFTAGFPVMDRHQQTLALTLYRQLALGAPVSEQQLAQSAAMAPEQVTCNLALWPAVVRDETGDIIGFWGLSLQASAHTLRIGQQTLYTWCAWDTLFIPSLLQASAHIHSRCPLSHDSIELQVSAQGIKAMPQPIPYVSFLLPNAHELAHSLSHSFCAYVHFLNEQAAPQWLKRHERAFMLTLQDAYRVGQQLNARRYPHYFTSQD